MTVSRRDFAVAAAVVLVLAVAIVRTAIPDRSRLRPLSVEGMEIRGEVIPTGEIVREATWSPPADVYVLGMNYRIGASGAGAELMLLAGKTALFQTRTGDAIPMDNPTFFQNTAAYVLRKGERLTLRYHVVNTGPPGETSGAGALIYFVPVEGN